MKISVFPILLLGIALSLSACHSKRKLAGAEVAPKDRSAAYVKEKMLTQMATPEWLQCKGNIVLFTNGNSLSANIDARLHKNQQMWMQAKKLGFEAIRARVTTDSAYAIDRLQQEYQAVSLAEFSAKSPIPIDLPLLQTVMMGHPLFMGSQLEVAMDSTHYTLTNVSNDYKISYRVAAATWQIAEMTIENTRQRQKIVLNMSDYEPMGKGAFAKHREIRIFQGLKIVNEATLDLQKISTDGPFSMPFEIPEHYEKRS